MMVNIVSVFCLMLVLVWTSIYSKGVGIGKSDGRSVDRPFCVVIDKL